jgi:hypothetical protein
MTLEWSVYFGVKKADGLILRWSVMLADDKGYIDVVLFGVEILLMPPTKAVSIGNCSGEG